jgi:hypothetical protein
MKGWTSFKIAGCFITRSNGKKETSDFGEKQTGLTYVFSLPEGILDSQGTFV